MFIITIIIITSTYTTVVVSVTLSVVPLTTCQARAAVAGEVKVLATFGTVRVL